MVGLVRSVIVTLARALLITAVTAALVVTATPAHAAVDDWTIPDKATIRINGHGYGHGHGMSQHGAQGAALQGLTHQEIVAFYYPGTTPGTAKGKVSVLVSADTSKDVQVLAEPGLKLRVLASGKVLDLAKARPQASRWRVTPVSGGRAEVSYRTAGWKAFRTVTGDAELFRTGAATTLVLPSGAKVAYRGVLRSVKKDTVNVLPLDKYLQGVVPQEVPALWEPQAVQAQAVAARTYAAYERAHPIASHYQICDTTSCQVYGGARPSTRPPPPRSRRPRARCCCTTARRHSRSSRRPAVAGPRPAPRRTWWRSRTRTTPGRGTRTRRGSSWSATAPSRRRSPGSAT